MPADVLAQLATGFAVAAADDRWVAVDLVSPEDDITSHTDYHLHMQMARFLRSVYPTSNQQILGIDRQSSQFLVYRAAGVPVVLSTDDEGVERIDLSREYQKAYRWFDLSYADLKKLSYQGVTSAFVSPEQRKRLKERLDGAFRAFEAKWIGPQVASP